MAEDARRLDQWLWFSRLFKSRSAAQKAITDGAIRVNRMVIGKPAYPIGAGDVLTFMRCHQVLVVRVLAIGLRRGPATEAATLYEIIEPSA